MNLNQVTLPAADLEASASFYRRMGFTQIVSSPHYARFECPEGDATFSIHEAVPVPDSRVVLYFESTHLDEQVARLRSEGFEFTSLPVDTRWLWREARLRDPSGNVLCLYFAGENRKNPPWRTR